MILRTFLSSKIHGARVTQSNVEYEGSIGIDALLMEKAGILPGEKVEIYDMTNGERLSTYVIQEKKGSGAINILGAAALKIHQGDKLIIVAYLEISEEEWPSHTPKVIHVDENNRPLS
jgi:aspartate 1-decarboxylase